MIREIILDTETTGLDPFDGHRIIEIGAVEMINKSVTQNRFHHYINPERDNPIESFRINGITNEMIKGKPLFKDICQKLADFIGTSVVIIHNAPFDIKFINYEFNRAKVPTLDFSKIIDTLQIAKRLFPGSRVNLDSLCRRFKIDISHRNIHGALVDALLLAEVYVELTGGRQTKFDLSSEKLKENNLNLINNQINTNYQKTYVLKPNEYELKKHKELLSKIFADN